MPTQLSSGLLPSSPTPCKTLSPSPHPVVVDGLLLSVTFLPPLALDTSRRAIPRVASPPLTRAISHPLPLPLLMRRPSLPSPLFTLTPPSPVLPPAARLGGVEGWGGGPGLRPRSASFSAYEERVEEERGRRVEVQLRKRRPTPLLPMVRDEQGGGHGWGKGSLQLQMREVEEGEREEREEEDEEEDGSLAAMLSPIYEQPVDFGSARHVQVTSP